MYHFILWDNGYKGLSLNCLGNFNDSTSDITVFVYNYIQNEIRNYIYREQPSLQLRETFSENPLFDISYIKVKKDNQVSSFTYCNHFFPTIVATFSLLVCLLVSLALIIMANLYAPLILSLGFGALFSMDIKRSAMWRLKEVSFFRRYYSSTKLYENYYKII